MTTDYIKEDKMSKKGCRCSCPKCGSPKGIGSCTCGCRTCVSISFGYTSPTQPELEKAGTRTYEQTLETIENLSTQPDWEERIDEYYEGHIELFHWRAIKSFVRDLLSQQKAEIREKIKGMTMDDWGEKHWTYNDALEDILEAIK